MLFADAEVLAEALAKSKERQLVETQYSTDAFAKCRPLQSDYNYAGVYRCRSGEIESGPLRPTTAAA